METNNLITAFLSDRKQQVVLDGAYSNLINVLYAVLKGTVLGPLLFLAYINDMPDSPRSSDARLCADDSLVYRTFNGAKGKLYSRKTLQLSKNGKVFGRWVSTRLSALSYVTLQGEERWSTTLHIGSMVKN